MCRFIAYLGQALLLEDALVKPVNSIVMQSLHDRESTTPTNGDGFGLGWYAPQISTEPGLFKSIQPAWNDLNLLHLTAKIHSPAFFAHVRAASTGGVMQSNCHPFVYGNWMFMHNGGINDFVVIKRHLRHLLDDDIYTWITGETDSEHFFALFLQLAKGRDLNQMSVLADVLQDTFAMIETLLKQFDHPGDSEYNICITDGHRVLGSRYCTNKDETPLSMHYAVGSSFTLKDGRYHMLQEKGARNCVLLASEKLTNAYSEWHDVPVNNLILVDADLNIEFRQL